MYITTVNQTYKVFETSYIVLDNRFDNYEQRNNAIFVAKKLVTDTEFFDALRSWEIIYNPYFNDLSQSDFLGCAFADDSNNILQHSVSLKMSNDDAMDILHLWMQLTNALGICFTNKFPSELAINTKLYSVLNNFE